MTENIILSESDEGEILSDLSENFEDELSEFPHVTEFIRKMRERINRQYKKIRKLQNRLQSQRSQTKTFVDYGTQTDPLKYEEESYPSTDWTTPDGTKTTTIVEQVKEAAESALQQTGFVYEETSGLYYDYNTGYYYDAKQGLYYNGNTGTYYYYDEGSQSFQFHSQAPVPNEDVLRRDSVKRMEKRKHKNRNKDEAKKHKHVQEEKSEDEPEEGECSGNSGNSSSEVTSEISTSSESDTEDEQDLAKTYPPCMRIIVKETNLSDLKVGSLFLVAYTGGSIGSEREHSVFIPDRNVSKYHARFVYDETQKFYQVIDSGSRNGTILNGKRLSVAKQESEPHQVAHGSIIQVGGTKLLCHIHNGNETCGHCEPGLIQKDQSTEGSTASKRDLHKQELKRLKCKFGVEKDNVAKASHVATGYQDRAEARRQNVGSLNHHAKTQQSSLDTSITRDNKGFKLLSKMGWQEGQSLGKDGSGRTEPVPLSSNRNKTGLGATEFPSAELDSNTEKKQALWRKTQQRYKEISD